MYIVHARIRNGHPREEKRACRKTASRRMLILGAGRQIFFIDTSGLNHIFRYCWHTVYSMAGDIINNI